MRDHRRDCKEGRSTQSENAERAAASLPSQTPYQRIAGGASSQVGACGHDVWQRRENQAVFIEAAAPDQESVVLSYSHLKNRADHRKKYFNCKGFSPNRRY